MCCQLYSKQRNCPGWHFIIFFQDHLAPEVIWKIYGVNFLKQACFHDSRILILKITLIAVLMDFMPSETMDLKQNTSASGYCGHVCGSIPAKSSWLAWSFSLFPLPTESSRISFSLNRICLHLGCRGILLVIRDFVPSIS